MYFNSSLLTKELLQKEVIRSMVVMILMRDTSDEWYVTYDQNGDGCAVEFPIKMKSSVTWTRCKAFSKIKEIKVKKPFFERLYMFVVKKRV